MVGLIVTFVLGAFVLFGALIAGLAKNGQRISEISIAIALGAMVMLLVDDLIPEAFEIAEVNGWPLVIVSVLAGVAILVLLDRFLPGLHGGPEQNDSAAREGEGHTEALLETSDASAGGRTHGHDHGGHEESTLHISIAATIALVAHNVVEGMSVCGLAQQSASMAIVLAIGVGLHNVPMGMIVYAGIRNEHMGRKVLILTCASLSTFLGGLIMFVLKGAVSEVLVSVMICVTIGLLLYIVIFELIPHVLRSKHKGLCVLFIIIGIAAVALSGTIEAFV